MPGAKLCAACRSALKRARNEPVSVLDPLQKAKTGSRKRNKAAAAQVAAGIQATPPKRRSATPALAGLLAAVLCIGGYLVLQHMDGAAHADPLAQAPASVALPAQPVAVTVPTESVTNASTQPVEPPVVDLPVPEPLPVTPQRVPRPKHAAPAPPPPVIEAPAPVAPAPVVVVAPPPKPAPPTDRPTLLRDAFAQCPEDVVLKAVCQQRARINYCDGLWGSVPQCPAQREHGS